MCSPSSPVRAGCFRIDLAEGSEAWWERPVSRGGSRPVAEGVGGIEETGRSGWPRTPTVGDHVTVRAVDAVWSFGVLWLACDSGEATVFPERAAVLWGGRAMVGGGEGVGDSHGEAADAGRRGRAGAGGRHGEREGVDWGL